MASTKKRLQIVAVLLAVALLLGVAVRMLDRDSGGQGGDYSGSYNEAYKNAELISCTFSQTGVWPDKLDDNTFMVSFSTGTGIEWVHKNYVDYVKALIAQDVNALTFAVREGAYDILAVSDSGARSYGGIKDTCTDGSPLFVHKVSCGDMKYFLNGWTFDNTTVPQDRYDYVGIALDESMLDMEWTFSIVLDMVALYCMYEISDDGTVSFDKPYTMADYTDLKQQLNDKIGLEDFEAFKTDVLQLNKTVYRVELDLYAMRGNEFLFPAD